MAHGHAAANPGGRVSFWASKPGYKPTLLLIAFVVFAVLVVIPPPQGMIELMSTEHPSGYGLPRSPQFHSASYMSNVMTICPEK